jgi:hypothetical protein
LKTDFWNCRISLICDFSSSILLNLVEGISHKELLSWFFCVIWDKLEALYFHVFIVG